MSGQSSRSGRMRFSNCQEVFIYLACVKKIEFTVCLPPFSERVRIISRMLSTCWLMARFISCVAKKNEVMICGCDMRKELSCEYLLMELVTTLVILLSRTEECWHRGMLHLQHDGNHQSRFDTILSLNNVLCEIWLTLKRACIRRS